MCGILLIYSKKGKLNKKFCENSLKSLKNRGPDATLKEYFLNQRLFIGNTILSIVGKIKNKNNLYSSNSKRFKLSYNGEIYNYKKLSKKNKNLQNPVNDTELLAKFFDYKKNSQIVKSLDGMFAYVVYDQKKKLIYLNSDVQGEKKIFFYEDDECLICSSSIKSILKYIRKKKVVLNDKVIRDYFDRRHFLNFNNSIYKNIKYLQPGHSYIYNINKLKFKIKKFDDPINWISKKKYLNFKRKKTYQVEKYFLKLLEKTALKMLPNIPFGSLMSGGIDSSLQSKIISKSIHLNNLLFIDHGEKDPIAKKINEFKKFFHTKLNKFKMTKKFYFSNLNKTYQLISTPFFTHDLVGRNFCYNFFKKKKHKVIFAADGADELFGGYELYRSINWNKKKIVNFSPYSNFKNKFSDNKTEDKILSNKLWIKAYKKYRSFLSDPESKMQASLFTDYFVQCIGVHNITTDLLSGENSIEVRNIFINKNVVKNAINLPIEYKINFKNKKNFILKPLLKNIFLNFFEKKLIYKKQGFSGFPNESVEFLSKKDKKTITNLKKEFSKKEKMNRSLEWKILNLYYFQKFLFKKFNFKKIFNLN